MDLQKYLETATKKMRDESFATSPQLTLGELIVLLKYIPLKNGDYNITIKFDFGTAYPTGLSSWRGAYAELGINYGLGGYDNDNADQFAHMDLSEFLPMLEGAVGKEFQGWKGEDFVMSLDTPLWVANDGNVGNTGVIGIKNTGYSVVILTQYCEY